MARKTRKSLSENGVEKTMAQVESGVRNLIRLIAHPDPEIGELAIKCILSIGPFAAEPLARAISEVERPTTRLFMSLLLSVIRRKDDVEPLVPLIEVSQYDPDEAVRDVATQVVEAALKNAHACRAHE
jgi:hypothetical protein